MKTTDRGIAQARKLLAQQGLIAALDSLAIAAREIAAEEGKDGRVSSITRSFNFVGSMMEESNRRVRELICGRPEQSTSPLSDPRD